MDQRHTARCNASLVSQRGTAHAEDAGEAAARASPLWQELALRAGALDREGQPRQAVGAYIEALRVLGQLIKSERDPLKRQVMERVRDCYLERAETLVARHGPNP